MKIRIIDLLNMIVNKEKLPYKIIYGYCEYTYCSEIQDYVNKDGLELFKYLFSNEDNVLLREVEIIKDKKIKSLRLEKHYSTKDGFYILNERKQKICIPEYLFDKIEELIEKVNYLLERSEDKNERKTN